MMPDGAGRGAILEEAARELEAAIHDARVAFDCIAPARSIVRTPAR
jgi:hypothetical protein